MLIIYFPVAPNIEFGQEYFEGVAVKAGDNIRIKVSVTGRPTPKVVWYKDDVQITKKMMDIISAPGSSAIFIRDSDRTNRGQYAVEASNPSGTKREEINVQVFGMFFYTHCYYVLQFGDNFTT